VYLVGEIDAVSNEPTVDGKPANRIDRRHPILGGERHNRWASDKGENVRGNDKGAVRRASKAVKHAFDLTFVMH
jgi:hypothetical protein